jgi:zinc D-Ala-D-Ala carboxypeptidase
VNDRKLSPHFSLFQLTATTHADLQAENRHVTREEELKLVELANLLETCRVVLGCDLDVHSGRRYLELNKRVGGSDRSQHLKCEAADFSSAGPDTEESVTDAWQKLATAARQGKFKFGQLIVESAPTTAREGRKFWVHISLGAPYRAKERCGEVLSMKDGKFTLISKIA